MTNPYDTGASTRQARWQITTEYDRRGVAVSRTWTADDSDYHVTRGTGAAINTFFVWNADGDEISAHGMLSDAIDDIERLESLVTDLEPAVARLINTAAWIARLAPEKRGQYVSKAQIYWPAIETLRDILDELGIDWKEWNQ